MSAVATLVLCFTLLSCTNISHYSATLMVTTNTPTKASISFASFNGTYVMQLKNKGADEAFITYEATLENGNIKVYYDFNDEKLNLFEIGANDSFQGKTETFTGSKTIYITIESEAKCYEGSFSFHLEKY